MSDHDYQKKKITGDIPTCTCCPDDKRDKSHIPSLASLLEKLCQYVSPNDKIVLELLDVRIHLPDSP